MKVIVRGSNVEGALRTLRKKVGDRLMECREREFYEKPAAKRHRKKKAAQLRERKRQRDDLLQP